MKDDQMDRPLDEWITDAAQSYHEPPEPPKEAMWQALQNHRRARHVIPLRRGRWVVWSTAAAAAVAVLAIGIAIGMGLQTDGAGNPVVAVDPGPVTGDDRTASTALAITTANHLAQTETFLSLFRDEVRSGDRSDLASATARHLLATNRLISDTPVTADPALRALLADLELVLAQIAQLSGDSWEGETDLITDGLEQSAVLTRLQGLVPAGSARTGSSL
jgi:hypothetical protein